MQDSSVRIDIKASPAVSPAHDHKTKKKVSIKADENKKDSTNNETMAKRTQSEMESSRIEEWRRSELDQKSKRDAVCLRLFHFVFKGDKNMDAPFSFWHDKHGFQKVSLFLFFLILFLSICLLLSISHFFFPPPLLIYTGCGAEFISAF